MRYTCQSLLLLTDKISKESGLRRSTRIKKQILDREYANTELSIDIYHDETQIDHDLDGTYILDWLESKGLEFTESMYETLMYNVYFKRDRTPSFLTYTWAYDRLGKPFIDDTDACEFTFYLFIVLEALVRNDIELLKAFKLSHDEFLNLDNFNFGFDKMFKIRGWDYFIPWFLSNFGIDPRWIFDNADKFINYIQSVLKTGNTKLALEKIRNLQFESK